MKNNKGFSILELLVSFTLTMTIVIFLFEIIVSMKDLYEKSTTKTELLNKQNTITNLIYKDLNLFNLTSVDGCGDNCISFTFDNGTIKNFEWKKSDTDTPLLIYDGFVVKYPSGSNFLNNNEFSGAPSPIPGQPQISESDNFKLSRVKICKDTNIDDYYISISMPIGNQLFKDEDFGLKLFYIDMASDDVTASINLQTPCI